MTAGLREEVRAVSRVRPLTLFVLVMLVVAACTRNSANPSGSTSSTPVSSVAPSSAPSTGPSVAPTLPPGTVVDFRTVVAGSGAGQRVGLVAPSASDPFAQDVTTSVLAQAKIAGLAVVQCDFGDDPSAMLDCARRLATQQVDGWIVVEPGSPADALCAVGPRSVPLLVVASAPVSCATAVLGADDARAGRLIGEALARIARTAYSCARDRFLIVGDSGDAAVTSRRASGIRAGVAGICPQSKPTQIDVDPKVPAHDALTAALTSFPATSNVLVAAVDDGVALATLAAVPADLAQRVTLTGVGADQRARCQIRTDTEWLGDAALYPDRYGEVLVPAMLDALRGRSVPRVMSVRVDFLAAWSLPDHYDLRDCPAR